MSQLPRSTPEQQGIASTAIIDFMKALHTQELELHSFMLVRHGHTVAEGWWSPYAPDRPHMLFSLSKSFTSTAIGLLVHEGRISIQDKVLSFFPEEAPAEVSENLAAMSVRDLLIMGTGHAEDTSNRMNPSDNWVQGFLQLPVEHEPGTHFVYNSGATYMLSAILQKVTGLTLLDYLQPRLLAPLGIEGATSESCPRGIHIGGWGIKVTTEDIAKFGQLYLQKGRWHGVQVVPESWVEEASSKQIDNSKNGNIDWQQGYGYQFWRCRHGAYRGDGAFGQYCIVMPQQDAVLAITSGVGNMQAVLDCVWEHLLPAMQPEPLAADSGASSALRQELDRLSLEPPRYEASSPLEPQVSGVEYAFEENAAGVQRFSIDFAEGEATVHVEQRGRKEAIRCGRNEWIEGTARLLMKEDNPVVASMAWQDAATLVLTIRLVETPFSLTEVCTFDDGNVQLTLKMNVSFGGAEPIVLEGKPAI